MCITVKHTTVINMRSLQRPPIAIDTDVIGLSLWATIRIWYAITIQPNMNTLFGLLFVPNRIQREYSLQP